MRLSEIRSVTADAAQGELVMRAIDDQGTEVEVRVAAPAVPAMIASIYAPASQLAQAVQGPAGNFQLLSLRGAQIGALADGRGALILILDNGLPLPILADQKTMQALHTALTAAGFP